MEDIYRQIGRRIREERKRRGWTQEQLAEKSDIHPSFIGQIERGTNRLSLKTLKQITDAMGTKAGELFVESPSPKALPAGKKILALLRSYSPKQQEFLYKSFQQLTKQLKKFPKK